MHAYVVQTTRDGCVLLVVTVMVACFARCYCEESLLVIITLLAPGRTPAVKANRKSYW